MYTGGQTNGLKKANIKAEAHHHLNGSEIAENAWSSPGPTAFDLRSDTITRPTTRMLEAIAATTLADDMFQEDPTTNNFEAFIADLTGMEAALFVMSGTMGNQVSLRTHLQSPPHSIIADHRAHIIEHEAGALTALTGAMPRLIVPKNGKYVTLEEVQARVDWGGDIHLCPTKVVCLENTLAGVVMPLEECRRIKEWATKHGILVHLDGARLWEAVAAGAGPLKAYCACFDSISICFSKGLGAPIGSMVLGSKTFIDRARWIRKMYGGATRQLGVLTAAARVSVEETFLGGKLKACHARAREFAAIWESHGGKLLNPVETNMAWLDLKASGVSVEKYREELEKAGLRAFDSGRLVVHYQISQEAIVRFRSLVEALLPSSDKRITTPL